MVTEYSLGESVLCSQGILIYEAKIQDIKQEEADTLYGIHYKGWNKSWDEYVPSSRLLKITEENLKKQKQLQEELKQSKKKTSSSSSNSIVSKKPQKKPGSDTDTSSREGSRDKDLSISTTTTSTKNVAVRLERLKKDTDSGDYNVNKDEKAPDKPVIKSKTRTIKPVIAFKATEVPKSMKKKKKDEKIDLQTTNKIGKSDKSVGNGHKIKREFGQEFIVHLPEVLKTVLVDDFDFMDRQRKLVNLPARYSVDDLLNDYAEFCKHNFAKQEVCRGLRDYFNCVLGSQLLYKFERVQYADVLKEHPGQLMSQLYSPVHLLRLLTRLGPMLTSVDMKEEDVNGLLENINHFVNYMETNSKEIFILGDYGTATPEYHRRAL